VQVLPHGVAECRVKLDVASRMSWKKSHKPEAAANGGAPSSFGSPLPWTRENQTLLLGSNRHERPSADARNSRSGSESDAYTTLGPCATPPRPGLIDAGKRQLSGACFVRCGP
jgi:hypothetical protein